MKQNRINVGSSMVDHTSNQNPNSREFEASLRLHEEIKATVPTEAKPVSKHSKSPTFYYINKIVLKREP